MCITVVLQNEERLIVAPSASGALGAPSTEISVVKLREAQETSVVDQKVSSRSHLIVVSGVASVVPRSTPMSPVKPKWL